MAEKIVVHCRCHRMVLSAGGGRSAVAKGLTHYSMKESAAPSDRLRSFGPLTNQGTVAKYLSHSMNNTNQMNQINPCRQSRSAIVRRYSSVVPLDLARRRHRCGP